MMHRRLKSVFQIRNFAQIRKPYRRTVNKGAFIIHLSADGGGNPAFQLSADAFGPQEAEVFQGICAQEIIFVRTEGSGIFLYVRADHFHGLFHELFKIAAFKIFCNQLIKVCMILMKISIVLHQIMVQRPVEHDLTGGRRIDGIINIKCGIVDRIRHSQGVSAECQIVIPGKDADAPLFLIKKIIVAGAAQITVQIYHKNLNCEITENLIHINSRFQIFAGRKDFQSADQVLLQSSF